MSEILEHRRLNIGYEGGNDQRQLESSAFLLPASWFSTKRDISIEACRGGEVERAFFGTALAITRSF